MRNGAEAFIKGLAWGFAVGLVIYLLVGCEPAHKRSKRLRDEGRLTLVECLGFPPDTAYGALYHRRNRYQYVTLSDTIHMRTAPHSCKLTVLR